MTDGNLPPYLDKSPADLQGEQWKDIPDFEDHYMVSNLGRIKSLERIIYSKNGAQWRTKERIMSAEKIPSANKHMGDSTYVLNIKLMLHGNGKTFSIRRLVYCCFVESIDLFDYRSNILCRDDNGLNLHYQNLYKATHTQKQEKIYVDQRAVSCFSYLDMKAMVQKRKPKAMHQLTQYDLHGKKLAVFPGIAIASQATGIPKSLISSVLRKVQLQTCGYIWLDGNGPEIISTAIEDLAKGKAQRAANQQKKVTQYNLKGEKVAEFKSLTAATQATGISTSMISMCITGHLQTAKGYAWRSVTGMENINEQTIRTREKFFLQNRKPVNQYTPDGTFVATHESVEKAAQVVGLHPSSISATARGINNQSAGFLWKFTALDTEQH